MKSKFRSIALCFSFFLSVLTAFAQTDARMTVKGVVRDSDGAPIAGVSVHAIGTNNGVVTGYDGDYTIEIKKGQKLQFSFLGFETLEKEPASQTLDVTMQIASLMMEQVVVTGYSSVELRKSTGAVAVVNASELKGSPLKSVDQLLQGQMAGVDIKATSGRPGSSSKVRIRGTNTITGNAEPLWVIDGVPMQKSAPSLNSSQIKSGDFDNIFATGIGGLNPNDIESITVLKDASAAAIYGSQAANGVIVVTTKNGREGKINISYMGSVSVQTRPSRSADLMNSKEKLAWEQELWDEFSAEGFAATQAGKPTHFPVVGIVGQVRSGYGKFAGMSVEQQNAYIDELGRNSTDWFDVLFRNTVSTSHHVSLSGGSNKVTYYVSGGFNYNNGVVVKTDSKSANFRAKIDTRPAPWIDLGFQTDFSYQNATAPSNNVNLFEYAYFANPYESLYNPDGSYRADETYFSLPLANGNVALMMPDNGFNIMREIKETSSVAKSTSVTITGNTKINIAKWVNFTGLASFSYNGDLSENINGKNTYAAFEDRPFDDTMVSKRTYGSITQMATYNTSYLLRGQFNFSGTVREHHNLSAIVGAEIRSSYAKNITTKRYGYDPVTGNHSTPIFPSPGGDDIAYDKLIQFGKIMDGSAGQSIIEDAFASFYGTATYNFRNRYIVSGTVRSDGSNNFGSDQQFNANWSVSGAWNIDQEAFMSGISHAVSTLGVRVGFGYTGGVNKSVFPVLIMNYSPTFRITEDDFYRMGYINNAPNPNLRWEKNRTFNVGLNYGFIHDRITGELAYYNNKNLDQVTAVRVPGTTGFTSQSFNTSEQINTGVEFTIGASIIQTRDFNWRLTANFAYNYNELTKYESPTGNVLGDYYVGYPLGKIFTGKTTGIEAETGLYDFVMRPDIEVSSAEDYRKYQNYLFYVGTSNAPWTGGLSTTFSYKGISLNLVGNFSIGGKVLNDITSPVSYSDAGAKSNEPIQSSKSDLYVNHLNVVRGVTHRWTVSNPITDGYPRLVDAYGPRLTDSSGYFMDYSRPYSSTISNCTLLEDVSYFKMSSISLSYSLPEKVVRKAKLGGISLGFLISNLFVVSNYSGIDPETPGAVYPQSRSFTFNLGLNF